MTDFQVGDRVSVEGVVTSLWPDAKPKPMCLVQVDRESYDIPADYWIQDQALTLVERPRRKLRVGSVWEHVPFGVRYVVSRDRVGSDVLVTTEGCDTFPRNQTTIDVHPENWREVPVDELERDAQ